jgi:hypothetical protein
LLLAKASGDVELPVRARTLKVGLTNLSLHQPVIHTPHLLQVKATVQVNGASKRFKQIAQYFWHLYCFRYTNLILLQQYQHLEKQMAQPVTTVLHLPFHAVK